jgi:hypothetical protein
MEPTKLTKKISQYLTSSVMAARNTSDFSRVEKISRYVKHMISSKRPSDCVLAILMSCKEAFRDLARATLLITDSQLIAFTLRSKLANQSRHLKSISCEGIRSGFILAVTDQDAEFCSAAFTSLSQAAQVIFSPSIICIPYFGNSGQLLCVLQLEPKGELHANKK